MIGVAGFYRQIELIYCAATSIQEPREFKSLFRMLSVTSLSFKMNLRRKLFRSRLNFFITDLTNLLKKFILYWGHCEVPDRS